MVKDHSTTEFSWDEVKSRLDHAQRSLVDPEHLDPEQIGKLMAERAQRLAQVPPRSLDTSEVLEVVRFQIGRENLAIETRFVLELTRRGDVTPIPEADEYFLGVINLRGEVTLIIDLARFFGLPGESQADPQVLVLGREKAECAVLIDRMDHVSTIRKEEILEPANGLGSMVDLLIGCTTKATMIIDGDALLECESLYLDQHEQ